MSCNPVSPGIITSSDQQVEGDALQLGAGFDGIARGGDAKAGFDQVAAEQLAQPRVIVDHQQMRFGRIVVASKPWRRVRRKSRRS